MQTSKILARLKFNLLSLSLKKKHICIRFIGGRFQEGGRNQMQGGEKSDVTPESEWGQLDFLKKYCKRWEKNVAVGPAWGGSIRITNFRPLGPIERELWAG